MIADAILLALEPSNLAIIFICTLYGAFVGAMPGLTATMAVSLLVPFTFFMDPIPAISAIVATTTTAIFAGDIAGALLRMPGTPASAAYVDDSFALARQGKARSTLLLSLFTAAIGGVVGVLILSLIAPQLARFAIGFSSYENFWLSALGLTCAVFAGSGTVAKSLASLFIGLFIATIGIDVAVGHPRFTFDNYELYDGVSFIPAMIGLFALSEVLRNARRGVNGVDAQKTLAQTTLEPIGAAARTAWRHVAAFRLNIARSSLLGTGIGALPGAGADIAAWICYAISRRFSKTPQAYGRGASEGIADGGSANNAAVAGAWTPALVFGIPGDSVTAIAIGVLLMKGLTPGPQIFDTDADLINALFGSFLIANLALIILRRPRRAGGDLHPEGPPQPVDAAGASGLAGRRLRHHQLGDGDLDHPRARRARLCDGGERRADGPGDPRHCAWPGDGGQFHGVDAEGAGGFSGVL